MSIIIHVIEEFMEKIFYPKLFSLLQEKISKKQIFNDIISGIIVGIVALPLSIAFAIASEVAPEKGIITAIIAGLLIAVFSGSRVQIGGPTVSFVMIVIGIIHKAGLPGIFYSTIIAGIFLVLFGLLKLGKLLKFIPHPLIIGFTSGISIVIFSTQVKDALGLVIPKLPGDFLHKWITYIKFLNTINYYALGITLLTILIIYFFKKKFPKVPGTFIAIILASFIVKFFELPVDTIETLYGKLNVSFSIKILPFDPNFLTAYLQTGFVIAILGGMESLLTATVSDGMIAGHHRSNTELIGQGIANIVTPLFGGIPATGALARTAVNIQNGGRTPISGIFHSITLLFLLLFFKNFIVFIPMSCLAGILIVVSISMSEYKSFISVLNGNNFDKLILLTTFFLTIFFDLSVAIEVGVVLSSILFMKRMSDVAEIQVDNFVDTDLLGVYPDLPQGLDIFEISGPFFFATARLYSDYICNKSKKSKVLIIRMKHVAFIDQTGMHALLDALKILKNKGIIVIISGANDNIRNKLVKNGIEKFMKLDNFSLSFSNSLELAKKYLI